jgi:prevent-host-death family protein
VGGCPATLLRSHDAKTNPSRIVERVERGEEIVISRAGARCPAGSC